MTLQKLLRTLEEERRRGPFQEYTTVRGYDQPPLVKPPAKTGALSINCFPYVPRLQ